MVTIDDIAREAGVSCTTVSNVIYQRTNRVSAATVERVNEIIKRLGYVPNRSARTLKTRSSRVVALIDSLDNSQRSQFAFDPFFSTLTGAVEEVLRARGYYLMIRAIPPGGDLLAFLRTWNVDGIFLPGLFEDDPLYQAVKELNMPVVLTDSFVPGFHKMVNIGLQDQEGARLATEHLIQNGHRRIAFAGPTIRPGGVIEKRYLGYQQALEQGGIAFDPSLVFYSEFGTDSAEALGRRIAERDDITAIFATADILAAGIMAGARQSGKQVPRDLSIVGFDDIRWCRMTNPTLTTIRQDTEEKGRLAAEYMIRLLEGDQIDTDNRILPVELIRRESVRNISQS